MASSPHVFLFDAAAEGVGDPALAYFTGEFLTALREVDRSDQTHARLKVGLPMLASFAGHTSAVSISERSSSHTQSYDMDTYRSLLWDFRNALEKGWHTVNPDDAMNVVGRRECECIALTALPVDLRDNLNTLLARIPGYCGAFELDIGNPVHRQAFNDQLIYLSAISRGVIIQELSYEGDPDWPTTGGDTFNPNGIDWRPCGWLTENGPPDIPAAKISSGGKASLALLSAKRSDRPEDRVIEQLSRGGHQASGGEAFEFAISPLGSNVLDAVLPDNKFTHFLFSRDHNEGAGKAKFFVEELGIVPEDWRYLAAQFYDGLLLAQPRSLTLRSWEGGYGANFSAHIRIMGRSGKRAVVRTAWMLRPGQPPQLVTAFPDDDDDQVVEPSPPPILLPTIVAPERWQTLHELAEAAGLAAQAEVVPTPMFISGGLVEPEGACGLAYVVLRRGKHSFGEWLEQTGKAERMPAGKVSVMTPEPTQSYERATAFAKAFARVAVLNGEEAEVEAHYS